MLIGILFLGVLVLMILIVSAVLTLYPNYKIYRKVYRTLPYRKYYLNRTQVYSHKQYETDDGFVWFVDTNEFCLERNTYIHSHIVTYFDPYTLYWLLKYRRWFKNNINLNTIEPY